MNPRENASEHTGADRELEFVRQTVARVLHLDARELDGEAAFDSDLGADSIDLCQVVTEAEQHFGIRITEEEAGDVTSLDGLAGLIRKKQLENRE